VEVLRIAAPPCITSVPKRLIAPKHRPLTFGRKVDPSGPVGSGLLRGTRPVASAPELRVRCLPGRAASLLDVAEPRKSRPTASRFGKIGTEPSSSNNPLAVMRRRCFRQETARTTANTRRFRRKQRVGPPAPWDRVDPSTGLSGRVALGSPASHPPAGRSLHLGRPLPHDLCPPGPTPSGKVLREAIPRTAEMFLGGRAVRHRLPPCDS